MRSIYCLLVAVLFVTAVFADGGHDMGHGMSHDGGHDGGHDHGGPPDMHTVGEQVHLVPCEYTATDGVSHYNLFPMASYEDYTTKFKPYDRDLFINICRDTVKPCDRNSKREAESHPVCLPTDEGEYSLGQTTHSHGETHHHVDITDSPLGSTRGVVLVYEGGDVCPADPTKKYETKLHLVCREDNIDLFDLLHCEEADFAPGDKCAVEITCYSRCACPNKPDCKNVLMRWGSDWNDWGHGWLGFLLFLEGIITITLDFGYLRGTKSVSLQKYPKLAAAYHLIVKHEEVRGSNLVTYKVDIEMLEALGLIVAGTMFNALTLKCCNIFHPPGSMHFLVGVCLVLLGVYGVVFGVSKRLKSKMWNFVMPATLAFISLMLIQHEQGGPYMTMMHLYLSYALMAAAFFRSISGFNKKFNLLSAISLMLAGTLLPGSSKSIVRFLEVKDVMPMTALFGLFMIVLGVSLGLVLLFLSKGSKYQPQEDEEIGARKS